MIIGTGSIGFAVVKGREVRVGGYGFPISDEGSGADLGLHAIRLALRAGDGRALATSFTREVMVRRTPANQPPSPYTRNLFDGTVQAWVPPVPRGFRGKIVMVPTQVCH